MRESPNGVILLCFVSSILLLLTLFFTPGETRERKTKADRSGLYRKRERVVLRILALKTKLHLICPGVANDAAAFLRITTTKKSLVFCPFVFGRVMEGKCFFQEKRGGFE